MPVESTSLRRDSLVRKIFPLVFLIVLVGISLLNLLNASIFRNEFESFQTAVTRQKAQVAGETLRLGIEELSTRTYLLSQSPLLRKMASEHHDRGEATEQTIQAVERLLESIIRNRPDINVAQVSLHKEPDYHWSLRTARVDGQPRTQRSVRVIDEEELGIEGELAGAGQSFHLRERKPVSTGGVSDVKPLPDFESIAAIESDDFARVGQLMLVMPAEVLLLPLEDKLLQGERISIGNESDATLLPAENVGTIRHFFRWMMDMLLPQVLEPFNPFRETVMPTASYRLPTAAGYGDIILTMSPSIEHSDRIINSVVYKNLLVQLSLLVVFVFASYLVARHVSAPIVRLRQTLADKQEDIESHDLPKGADADLQDLFQVILENARSIRTQKKLLHERMDDLLAVQGRLNQAYKQLQFSQREKDELVKVTAHDLREPLLVVQSCSRLIPELIDSDEREELDRTFGFIESAIGRMAEQLERMRRFFRLGASDNIARVDVKALADTVKHELADVAAQARNAAVSISGEGSLVAQDEDIKVLLRHLINNAIRYRRDFCKPTVDVTISELDGGVSLQVRDNGMGIPTENHERIFQLFYRRTGAPETMRAGGTSLAECRKVTEIHQGRIWVENNDENGVTFHVELRDRKNEEAVTDFAA